MSVLIDVISQKVWVKWRYNPHKKKKIFLLINTELNVDAC